MITEATQGKAMARKTFCTLDPNAFAMAAAGLFCWAISTEATALGKEVPMAHTVMPGGKELPKANKKGERELYEETIRIYLYTYIHIIRIYVYIMCIYIYINMYIYCNSRRSIV